MRTQAAERPSETGAVRPGRGARHLAPPVRGGTIVGAMAPVVDITSLPFTPAGGAPERIAVSAYYFEGQIDTKGFRAAHLHYPVLAADPLVIEPVRGSYVAVTKFGALVLWNCAEAVSAEVIGAVGASSGAGRGEERLDDQLEVLVGQPENRVTFNEVWVRELTLEKLTIISIALAQSVALDRIEHEVAGALKRFEPVVAGLRAGGKLTLGEREVLQAMGFALEVRQQVLANLTLFDKPPETWESESLERLDNQLYDFFDLEERLAAIKEKVAYFSDMNSTLGNLLNHRKSVRLEWIVIILILIEVVLFVVVELKPKPSADGARPAVVTTPRGSAGAPAGGEPRRPGDAATTQPTPTPRPPPPR